MNGLTITLLAALYLTTLGAGLWAWSEARKKRPKSSDEVEASIAQNRLRVADLEDRVERHIKRDAVRDYRAKEVVGDIPNDRQSRLLALRSRIAAARQVKGGT